jgi:2-oxoglutarate ferredoxin oxidoreductase subunit beta
MSTVSDSALRNGKLTRKDFTSDQEVRWCPGCGDYAILKTVQALMPELGIPREKIVFVSGIGCSSRFPYYMDTYGFHSIHGRAPAIATGIKLSNPELSVWVVTGDGDGLSIGGNHLIHALRRNIDLKILLFDNRIYGLTKGQCSPTSDMDSHTKSTPFGSIDQPFNPISLGIGAEATFVASTVDVFPHHMKEVLTRAAAHRGSCFIQIYQNCVVFNDQVFGEFTDKPLRADNTVLLEHNKPLIFGKERNKGIRLHGRNLEVVEFEPGAPPDELLVHHEDEPDATIAYILSRMRPPGFPVPLGIFRTVQRRPYSELVHGQIEAARATGVPTLQSVLEGPEPWRVS